ncbi:serine/threonine-protein kinase [Leptothrix discophora]|uniref:Serine/threonine-protein kinase n=1 Tax=Leptothrix discophora TaxID=89 RepID=A0ABT9G3S3_LEPDI|nr:serine/threonine-protein kinase [Leptothrix discophora]MDP4301139.1 serine/threonine-protein kinase [Leptothrix discophora]
MTDTRRPDPPDDADGVASESGWPVAAGDAKLGHYLLDRELGRGAMGRVYRAHDIRDGRVVAIKTLALGREFQGYALDEARTRFQREAQAASRLRHPDIVDVIDGGDTEELAYLVMELLSGCDLSHHIRPATLLPVSSVVAIGARVADALAHAHAHDVVHRDIKPANVMVDARHDRVKVMDFGVARLLDASRTRTGLVLGSPSYMSPEQLAGRTLDGRSDLYSLGVVLFQLLTSRLPCNGATMTELMAAVAHQPAPDARHLRPGLPDALADVVTILLEKRPELRYADGHSLAGDLRLIAARMQPRDPQAAAEATLTAATGGREAKDADRGLRGAPGSDALPG